jgi:Ala-tRNA(Pro) deacylase
VYVDTSVAQDEEIAFNAGSHHELMRMAYSDFACLVGPDVSDIRTEKACAHGPRHAFAHSAE